MEGRSLLEQAKELETSLRVIASQFDQDSAALPVRQALRELKHQAADVRLDVRDYDYAQTRAEQQTAARQLRPRLERLRQLILQASEHGVFGAVDVAHLSARIEHILTTAI